MLHSFRRLAQDLGLKDFVLDLLLPNQLPMSDQLFLMTKLKAEVELSGGSYLECCEVFGCTPPKTQLICSVYITHDEDLKTTSLLFKPSNFVTAVFLLNSFLTDWVTAFPENIVRLGPLCFSQQAYVFDPYPSPVVGGPQAPTVAGLVISNVLSYLATQPPETYARLTIQWVRGRGFLAAHSTIFHLVSPDYPDDHFYNLELQRWQDVEAGLQQELVLPPSH